MDNSDTTFSVWNNEQTQQFNFGLDKEVSSIEIDPDKWILRKTEFNPELPVGIRSIDKGDRIKIYPNPFSSVLTIYLDNTFNNRIETSIIDIAGKTIQSLPNQGSNIFIWDGTANGAKVKPGIYFVRIKTDSRLLLKKVLLTED
jgi:hypothetical protein